MANEFIKARRFRRSLRATDTQVGAPAAAPFFGESLEHTGNRRTQRGVVEVGQSLLLTTLAVAVVSPFFGSTEQTDSHYERKLYQQIEQKPAPYALSVAVVSPFFGSTEQTDSHYERKLYQQIEQKPAPYALSLVFQPGNVLVQPMPWRREAQQPDVAVPSIALNAILAAPFLPEDFAQQERKIYPQVEPHQNPYGFYGILSAPFVPQNAAQQKRKSYQQTDQVPSPYTLNVTITDVPFLSVDFAQQERRLYQQVDPHQNPFAREGILSAPFLPQDYAEQERKIYPQVEPHQNPYGFYGILSQPFRPVDPAEQERKLYQQVEPHQNPYGRSGILAAPFLPQDYAEQERKPQYQVEQTPAPYALYAILSSPFEPIDLTQPERRYAQQPDQSSAYALLNEPVVGTPFLPYDWPQPGRVREAQQPDYYSVPLTFSLVFQPGNVLVQPMPWRREAQQPDVAVPSIALLGVAPAAAPFRSFDFSYSERLRQQQPDLTPAPYVLITPLAVKPFVPVDTNEFEHYHVVQIDQHYNWLLLTQTPAPVTLTCEPRWLSGFMCDFVS